MSRAVLDRVLEGGLVGLFLFAPLPLGSVLPWAQGVLEAAVALLVALWVVRMLREGGVTIRVSPLLGPAAAMGMLVALQLLRPGGSASPYATAESARLYAAYVGLLLVLGHHLVTRARIVRFLAILIGWGTGLALLALVHKVRGRAVLLGFPGDVAVERLTSTFVNPNHQALYFALLLCLALGLLLRPRAGRRAEGAGEPARPAARPLERPAGAAWLLAALVPISTALLLTLSRGGLVATLGGFLVIVALTAWSRLGRWAVVAPVAVLAGVVLHASWLGLDPVLARFSELAREPVGQLRWGLALATLRLAADAPVLGHGLGAFEDAFARYRPADVPSRYVVDYAHNDYLQLVAETGLAGLAVLGWALVALTTFVVRAWAGRRDPFVRGLTLGGLGALGVVLVHSALDFGAHVPANALLVVLVAALLPAVVTLRATPPTDRARDRAELPEWRRALSAPARLAGLAAVVAGALGTALVVVPPALADWSFQQATAVTAAARAARRGLTTSELVGLQQGLEDAARLDPGNPRVQAARAQVAAEVATLTWAQGVVRDGGRVQPASPAERRAETGALLARAADAYQAALQARPLAAELHERYAWFLAGLEALRRGAGGSSPDGALDPRLAALLAGHTSLAAAAQRHLEQAVHVEPQNAARHRARAVFALVHLGDDPAGRRLAADSIRTALRLEPALLPGLVDDLVAAAADAELVRTAVPREYPLLLELARQLGRHGRSDLVLATLDEALALAAGPDQRAVVRLAAGRARLGQRDAAGAVAEAREALRLRPGSVEATVILAEAHEAAGQGAEAEEAWGSAARLAAASDPTRAHMYRVRLASLVQRRGDAGRALRAWREVLAASPNDAWAHLQVGRLLEARGAWAEAFREYRVAETLDARHGAVQREVGRVYARQGLLREAAVAYERALRLRPTDGALRMELGELYARMGWRDRAIEHYRALLAQEPDHEGARRRLAALGVEPEGGRRP